MPNRYILVDKVLALRLYQPYIPVRHDLSNTYTIGVSLSSLHCCIYHSENFELF